MDVSKRDLNNKEILFMSIKFFNYENLIKKKSIRIRLINSLYSVLNTITIVSTIGKEMNNVIDPILNEFMTDMRKVSVD